MEGYIAPLQTLDLRVAVTVPIGLVLGGGLLLVQRARKGTP
jgi:hypothetical protein